MRDQESPIHTGNMMLSAREGAPSPFTIIIREGTSCTWEINGQEPPTKQVKTLSYELHQRDHGDYQDLFEKLSTDFGLRLPLNRRKAKKPVSEMIYREVLTRNLAPGIIYGYGDPAIIKVNVSENGGDPWYYLVSTSNDAPDSFPIIRSKDLVDWEFTGYVFPRGQKPVWAKDGIGISDFWAPEMHWIHGEFRVYFVARDKHTADLCIGVARSSQPCGPFIPDALPLLNGNRIDPHVFLAANNCAWLYWKEDNNDTWPGLLIDLLYEHPAFIPRIFAADEDQITASFMVTLWPWARVLEPMERFQAIQIFIETIVDAYYHFKEKLLLLMAEHPQGIQEKIHNILHHMETPIFAQQLSDDGSSLVGEPAKILKNDLVWEAHLIEGMWVTKESGKFYIFYSGNDFSTDQYGIGVAIADSHLGPFTKMEKPLLQSTKHWWAPGHPSVVADPEGKATLFLHGYFPGKAGYRQFRALLSTTLTFTGCQVLVPFGEGS